MPQSKSLKAVYASVTGTITVMLTYRDSHRVRYYGHHVPGYVLLCCMDVLTPHGWLQHSHVAAVHADPVEAVAGEAVCVAR